MSFKEIKGQDKAIDILKAHVKNNCLRNGYIFSGPEGVGKGLTARILAKALNCQNEEPDSCDNCASCAKIDKNEHPDVHFIDPQAEINPDSRNEDYGGSEAVKIGHIRRLQRDIALRPYEGRKKVFIIDNAHNLTPAASNALLKVLEEPPANSLIILISAKTGLLFKTIISRCQVLKFYPMDRNVLQDILKKEYSLDEQLAHFLAYSCEGKLGKALELKEQDPMQDKNKIIDQFVLAKHPGEGNISIRDRAQMRSVLNVLAGWFRDMYLVKAGATHNELIHLDRKQELLKAASRFSFKDLDEGLSFISDSVLYLDSNVNIKLLTSNLRIELWRE